MIMPNPVPTSSALPSAALVSDNWPSDPASILSDMPEDDADRVRDMITQITPLFPRIEQYATSLHPRRRRCRVVKDRYTWGQSFAVFEIAFEAGRAIDSDEDMDERGTDHSDVEEDFIPRLSTSSPEFPSSANQSWIIRCGLRPINEYFGTAAQLERKILNEVAALHIVQSQTTIPVPRIYAYHPVGDDPKNPLGEDAPAFVMMNAMSGVTIAECGISLDCWDLDDEPSTPSSCGEDRGGLIDILQGDMSRLPFLERYLHDLADMHVQLSKIRFPKIGSFALRLDNVEQEQPVIEVGPCSDFGVGPFDTAKEYFELRAEAYDKMAMVSNEDDEELTGDPAQHKLTPWQHNKSLRKRFVSSLWRTAMLHQDLIHSVDNRGPFPMQHGDLHHENILVDPKTGAIVGVLDWDCAQAVPWEMFAVPSFELSGYPTATPEDQDSHSLVIHDMFNQALRRCEASAPCSSSSSPSGRSLSELHNSDAGHVGSYLAYWMYSLGCDFDHTGRALYELLEGKEEIEMVFADWATRHLRRSSSERRLPSTTTSPENPLSPPSDRKDDETPPDVDLEVFGFILIVIYVFIFACASTFYSFVSRSRPDPPVSRVDL